MKSTNTTMKHNVLPMFIIIMIPFTIMLGFEKYFDSKTPSTKPCPGSNPCEVRQQSPFIQIVFQPNTHDQGSLAEDILYQMSKQVRPKHSVEVSVISSDGVRVIYSNQASKRAIQELRPLLDSDPLTSSLEPIPSDESQLVKGVQRFRDRVAQSKGEQPVFFYLVTNGTKDPQIIAQIQEICRSIPPEHLQNARFYVMGLTPENRLPISSAFSPIRQSVEFASNDYNEWVQLIRKF